MVPAAQQIITSTLLRPTLTSHARAGTCASGPSLDRWALLETRALGRWGLAHLADNRIRSSLAATVARSERGHGGRRRASGPRDRAVAQEGGCRTRRLTPGSSPKHWSGSGSSTIEATVRRRSSRNRGFSPEGSRLSERALTKAPVRPAALPIEGGGDWYVEAADPNRVSSRLTERRRMSLRNDPRRAARRLRSPVGA